MLDVLADENLPAKAVVTGEHLRKGFCRLAQKHDLIGDVRGSGLANGVELVLDRATKTPATETATRVINQMR